MLNASNPIATPLLARAAGSLSLALLLGAGCDLAVYPTTAEYVAQEAARASVDLDAASMPAAADVVDVEVTVDTVAMHRAFDDRWILLAGDEVTTTLVAEPRNATVADVPMRMQAYDKISLGITQVRVATEDGWHEATLARDEVELDGEFLVDTDITLALTFDLLSGLEGDARAGFVFEPLVTADILPAR
ncbi:MAG: hypothetical protein ACE37F_10475 [Nannocystaceae bacterium]|nr:hypothetical protein [bacterium]